MSNFDIEGYLDKSRRKFFSGLEIPDEFLGRGAVPDVVYGYAELVTIIDKIVVSHTIQDSFFERFPIGEIEGRYGISVKVSNIIPDGEVWVMRRNVKTVLQADKIGFRVDHVESFLANEDIEV